MIHFDTYRVQGVQGRMWGGGFKANHWWNRTWQCEWDGCLRAPRAWTERGVLRKARRLSRHL